MAWASESVAPQFYLVPMPAVQIRQSLPPSARDDRNAAERFALKTAKKRDCRAVLVWNRRWTFWIARDGQGWWSETTPGRPNEPLATVGNKSLRLGFE